MIENNFNPYVRFCMRRRLSVTYPHHVYAYDFRLLYTVKGKLEVELENKVISLEEFSLLTVPPGAGYRLIVKGTPAEFFIINFDFDSEHAALPARAPVPRDFFSEEEIFSKNCVAPFEAVFHLTRVPELEPILSEMNATESANSSTTAHLQSALMKYILSKAIHLSAARQMDLKNPLIQAIKDYVDHGFARPINNKTIAAEMGYHPHYLNTCFLRAEGMTLHTYIERTRLKHAQRLLMCTQDPICEIAEACGFAESSYFTKFFIRHTGMPPKRYRELSM